MQHILIFCQKKPGFAPKSFQCPAPSSDLQQGAAVQESRCCSFEQVFFHLPEGFQPPLMADFFTRRLVVDKVLTSLAGYFTQFLLNDPDLVHAVVGEVDEPIGRVKTSC